VVPCSWCLVVELVGVGAYLPVSYAWQSSHMPSGCVRTLESGMAYSNWIMLVHCCHAFLPGGDCSGHCRVDWFGLQWKWCILWCLSDDCLGKESHAGVVREVGDFKVCAYNVDGDGNCWLQV